MGSHRYARNVPAEFGEMVLIGMERTEAMKLASLANAEQTLRIGEGCIAGTGLRLSWQKRPELRRMAVILGR